MGTIFLCIVSYMLGGITMVLLEASSRADK